MLAILASAGCPPPPTGIHPPPDVNTGAADPACDFCYTATLDNPVMSDSVLLRERADGLGGFSFETASTNTETGAVSYQDFFLQLSTSGGDPTKGAVDDTLPIVPHDTNTYQPGDTMQWDGHGMQLGYTDMTLTGQNVNAFGGVTLTPPAPPAYRLASNVMLVPIQLIRVLPQNPQQSQFSQVYNITGNDWKRFFDDRPMLDVFHDSSGFPNGQYIYHRTFYTPKNDVPPQLVFDPENQEGESFAYDDFFGDMTPVDQIWAQCGIQFRMIDCGAGPYCPDLLVTDDSLIGFNEGTGQNCQSPRFTNVETDLNNAAKLPGVDPTLPLVLAMWDVSGTCFGGWPLEVGDVGVAALSYNLKQILASLAAPATSAAFVPSHEMGHLLGLGHATCDGTQATENLMCPDAGNMNGTLTSGQCMVARQHASAYVKAKWGVTVNP